MLGTLLIGIGYALSAGLQPGPLQAFFLAKVSEQGWRRTLPAAFAPLVSDGPIALVSILLLNILPVGFRDLLQLGGGILLCIFAWSAFRSWKQDQPQDPESSNATPRTVLQAALINLLNPNPYLGWSLVMGPAVLSAWADGPGMAAALLLAFYITMISTSMVMIYLMGQALLLGPGARKGLNLVSALLLAGLGLYFLYLSTGRLTGLIF
ncbi:MAG: LysE family transporter [Anaerolineales bacterium]|nr:LysE family transporter [Anaerolineales bacterium]